jgi:hypothetical protein
VDELLTTGKVNAYQGHHVNSVNGSPELAGDPNNIEFVRAGQEHLSRHRGTTETPQLASCRTVVHNSAMAAIQSVLERARPLGVQMLPDGTALIGRAPHIATEAWLHILFAPLHQAEVEELNKRVGRPVPRPLVELFLQTNGLSLFSDALAIFGLRRDLRRTAYAVWQPFDIRTPNVQERPSGALEKVVFFASYKSDGSLIYMDSDDDQIHRCSRDSAKPLNTWKSLDEMLSSEVERLTLLFDSEGRKKDPRRSTAPMAQQ